MNLSQILTQVEVEEISGSPDPTVLGIAYDSRKVETGYLFAALKGEREDGSKIDVSYTLKYDGKAVTMSGAGLPYDTLAVFAGE